MRSDAAAGDGTRSDFEPSRTFRALRYVIVAGLLLVPIAVSPAGEYTFREPKIWLVRLEAIVVSALLVRLMVRERPQVVRLLRSLHPWPAFILVTFAWTAVTAAFSTNRPLSVESMIWVATFAIITLGTLLVASVSSWRLAGFLLPAAVLNTAVYLLQEFDVFNPFHFPPNVERHLTRTALVGNPSDVGMYLLVPTVIAAALALSMRRWRGIWIAALVVAAAGTLATASLTAAAAMGAALLVTAALIRPRAALVAFAVLLAVLVAAPLVYGPARERVGRAADAIRAGDFDVLVSYRTTPLIAAARMAAAHPLTGVGSGTFGYNYYDHKIAIEQRTPKLATSGAQMFNFGEVHSDHLQIAAQTGIVGYALFLAILWMLARHGLRTPRDSGEEASIARYAAPALAAGFAVLAIAQFPLELAAPTHAFLSAAAMVAVWSRPA